MDVLGQEERTLMGRSRRGLGMKLFFTTGRDLCGLIAPDYNRLKACFGDQCKFSLFIDHHNPTSHMPCHESAKILASCLILKGQTTRRAAAFS